jgi:hypothetical protein
VSGDGLTVSIALIILNIGVLIILVGLASLATDIFMQNFPYIPEKHRKIFTKFKTEESEDLNNL